MKNNNKIKYSGVLYFIFFILITYNCRAQVNYVINGGFEQYSNCPYNLDQIKFAKGWQPIDTNNYPPIDSFGSLNCTPEYCNVCAGFNSIVGVPNNSRFYHYTHTGNGMAQVQMYIDNVTPGYPYERDYLQSKLSHILTANKQYCVTFFVTLEQASGYAINHIGAYLDNGIIDTTQNCGLPQTTHIPQVQTLNIIKDTLNWTKIEGTFTANGTENYITIGNFYDFSHTDTSYFHNTINNGSHSDFTWYLVDDVSVVESDIPAYAGGWMYKGKKDSLFIGRNEIVPDCMWYRNGALIDTLHAGFWVKDTVNTIYVVKQSICGNVKYDTAWVNIEREGVTSVGNESIYRIYPNPATTEITIQAPNNTGIANLTIWDMSGKALLHNQIQFLNGTVRVPISLNSGIYFIELTDERGNKNIQRLSVL